MAVIKIPFPSENDLHRGKDEATLPANCAANRRRFTLLKSILIAASCAVFVSGCGKGEDKNQTLSTVQKKIPDAVTLIAHRVALNPQIGEVITSKDLTDPDQLFVLSEKSLETAPPALNDIDSMQARERAVYRSLKAYLPINSRHLISLQCGQSGALQQTFFARNRITHARNLEHAL